MTLGVAMLVHEAPARAAQVVRHWARHGCAVVIHVDRRLSAPAFAALRAELAAEPLVRFCARYRCEWGTWSLVRASQEAVALLLAEFPAVSHVLLASGACLPLRPVGDLLRYLDRHPRTDFIESVTVEEVGWTVGGLDRERFTLRFPFSWRRHRRLFDASVRLQRRLGIARRLPGGLEPHLGSQWWCLTRTTLEAIAADPGRAAIERHFRQTWIPDESYYQTLARRHSRTIESRSLTFSRFDFQGKPHVFYDDHLQLLRRSDCFVARKIWPRAGRLYDTFLGAREAAASDAEPRPERMERVFAEADARRTMGRPGLVMQSSHPHETALRHQTAGPYVVFEGFAEVFPGFDRWVRRHVRLRLHRHLFAPERVEFERDHTSFAGALPDSARLRDSDPAGFLRNLVWNLRGERQGFRFGPRDDQQISPVLARDPNAAIFVISGAWAIALWRAQGPFADIRREAARLQRIEAAHLAMLRRRERRARTRVWSLADAVLGPADVLGQMLGDLQMTRGQARPATWPELADLAGFGQFLQKLRNAGMEPHLMGSFPDGGASPDVAAFSPFGRLYEAP